MASTELLQDRSVISYFPKGGRIRLLHTNGRHFRDVTQAQALALVERGVVAGAIRRGRLRYLRVIVSIYVVRRILARFKPDAKGLRAADNFTVIRVQSPSRGTHYYHHWQRSFAYAPNA